MGWKPTHRGAEAGERRVAAARFDSWQNRPDRRQRPARGGRALLAWFALLAVLALGYAYGGELALAGWNAVARLLPELRTG